MDQPNPSPGADEASAAPIRRHSGLKELGYFPLGLGACLLTAIVSCVLGVWIAAMVEKARPALLDEMMTPVFVAVHWLGGGWPLIGFVVGAIGGIAAALVLRRAPFRLFLTGALFGTLDLWLCNPYVLLTQVGHRGVQDLLLTPLLIWSVTNGVLGILVWESSRLVQKFKRRHQSEDCLFTPPDLSGS